LQSDQKEPIALNLYCWNGVISACQKGGAWVEALDLYERMLIESPRISPNFVTLNSLLEALDGAGQQELVQSKFEEALMMGIVNPWKKTWDKSGNPVMALDLHRFSKAMAVAAIRHVMDTWCDENNDSGGEISGDLHIITGKGIHSEREPVLQKAVIEVMNEYHIKAVADPFNPGRVILGYQDLLDCFSVNSWR
jgi:pentatricopeptide repeat protein